MVKVNPTESSRKLLSLPKVSTVQLPSLKSNGIDLAESIFYFRSDRVMEHQLNP